MKILGIESSCDETSVAVVNDNRQILFHKTLTQTAKYGGIVPELASRSHLENIDILLKDLVQSVNLNDIDAVAVTAGPGLIGSLMVGVICAKVVASILRKPIIAVNHLSGHALTIRLVEEVSYPFLTLLVSGGNTQFLIVRDANDYVKLGETLDDALGEAFDKVARMLGLGYPGGPKIEQRASAGDENKYALARPMMNSGDCNFSFSGLKTDVARKIKSLQPLDKTTINDLCAGFQCAITDVLEKKILIALDRAPACNTFVLCGGVSANKYIQARLEKLCNSRDIKFLNAPISLCGDNAAMIAWAGLELYRKGFASDLTFMPRAKWPL